MPGKKIDCRLELHFEIMVGVPSCIRKQPISQFIHEAPEQELGCAEGIVYGVEFFPAALIALQAYHRAGAVILRRTLDYEDLYSVPPSFSRLLLRTR